VEDGRFEIEDLSFIFEWAKDGNGCEVELLDGCFGGLQVFIHRQNRQPAFGVAVDLIQAALLGWQKFEQGGRRVAHSTARLHTPRPVVVAAAAWIGAGLPGRFFDIFYYN
jgi:hypothetical protein